MPKDKSEPCLQNFVWILKILISKASCGSSLWNGYIATRRNNPVGRYEACTMQRSPNSERKLETFHDSCWNNPIKATKLFTDLSQVKAIEVTKEGIK